MWAEQENAWHLGFALIWASTFVVVVLAPAGAPRQASRVGPPGRARRRVCGVRRSGDAGRWRTAGARLSRPGLALRPGDAGAQRGHPVVVAVLHPLPHLWVVLHTRLAIITTVLIPRRPGGHPDSQSDGSREVLTSIGLSNVISLGLSSLWVCSSTRILREAQTQARTIDEAPTPRATNSPPQNVTPGVLDPGRERLSARDPRHPRAGVHVGAGPVAGWTDDPGTGPRRRRHRRGARLALVDATARDNLSEARLIVADLTPGHLSRTLVEALGRLTAAVSAETRCRPPSAS